MGRWAYLARPAPELKRFLNGLERPPEKPPQPCYQGTFDPRGWLRLGRRQRPQDEHAFALLRRRRVGRVEVRQDDSPKERDLARPPDEARERGRGRLEGGGQGFSQLGLEVAPLQVDGGPRPVDRRLERDDVLHTGQVPERV